MDEEVKAQLRANETTEKKTNRQRRYRTRLRAKIGNPVYTPRLQKVDSGPPAMASHEDVDGRVICGHCRKLFADASAGAVHVPICLVRLGRVAREEKGKECCIDQGEEWHKTPCLCDCHYRGSYESFRGA